ncbi:radical SAM protein [Aquihabitans daechungensis]|uniref:radical SAM protein n=1 Tax=Aquihabitans daechungensis TaxID=1052257 RepID=UPI003BA1FC1C
MRDVDDFGCHAPASSLYFRPDGWVTPCCASWHLLGRVTGPERESLRAIWNGYRSEALRTAVAVGDPSLGCWECGRAAAAGNRASSLAADFDPHRPEPDLGPRVLDFALSNRCNLECVMCNGGLSSSIRKNRDGRPPLPPAYDDRFFDELAEMLPGVERTDFKGGEPFLSPESRRVWDLLIDRPGPPPLVSVTTNGTVWNEGVAHYVEALAMKVFASVDAMDPDVLRSIRTGIDPQRFWRNVDRFQQISERTGAPFNLQFCLMAQNWRELRPFLDEADRRGAVPHVIWVDGPRDYSLMGLAPAHLAEVDAAWSGDPGPTRPSAASAQIWADARSRVAGQVADRAAAPTAVPVGAPTRRTPTSDRPGARRALEQLCRPGLIEVQYRNEIVQAVRTQPWAGALDPERWIGSGLEELPTLLAVSSGGMLRSDVEVLGKGSYRLDLRLETDPPVTLIGYYLPDDDQRSGTLLLGAAQAELQVAAEPRAIRV